MNIPENPYRARATKSGLSQSIPSGVFTAIGFDTKDYDPNSNYDTTASVYTAPVAGYYAIKAQVKLAYSADAAPAAGTLSIFVNGTQRSPGQTHSLEGTKTGNETAEVDDTLLLAAGDLVDIRYVQSTGVSLSPAAPANASRFTVSLQSI